MLEKISLYLHSACKVQTQHRLLVAVSGGIDSVVLAYSLKSLGFNLGIAHCNFQLRQKASQEEAIFVEKWAQQLDCPFYIKTFETESFAKNNKLSIQMAARQLRYEWFEQLRKQENYHFIATAHHQNDLIETVLLNLTKGTGLAGLHGILPKNGYLVRPLLCLTKEEIITFQQKVQLKYKEDASNSSTKYARNQIRLEIVPVLKQLNPKLEATFMENTAHFKDAETLYHVAIKDLKKNLLEEKNGAHFISIKKLQQTPAFQTVLWEILKDFDFSNGQLPDILSSLEAAPGKLFYSKSHRLLKDRKFLIISQEIKNEEGEEGTEDPTFAILNGEEGKIKLPLYKLNFKKVKAQKYVRENNPKIVGMDLDTLVFPLKLRKWKAGDYFYPLGLLKKSGKVGKKKLKDYFINQKFSIHQKEQTWILQDQQDRIVWIVGERLDDRFKIKEDTQNVFHIRMKNDQR